jgi:hypothetical protein
VAQPGIEGTSAQYPPSSAYAQWHGSSYENLVEAAGVEPASEKARHEKNYVRFRFVIVGRRLRTGKKTTA